MKHTIVTLGIILITLTGNLFAEPASNQKCCQPEPVGGMQALNDMVIYPLSAKALRTEGNVKLQFLVDAEGAVSSIKVLSSDNTLLTASAVNAIESVKWLPAKQAGKAVPVYFELPFEFRYR